ncbi:MULTISPECIES: LysE/ArgO family amino acid transporter [unclassified Dietzia]|uniref:LysE/ArgO family amino acid transporter n=1 Tax=unclassified Dietzia TaxID=2617939 RepID=UPI000D21979A|nr:MULTISPECIES: LysE/ArgO family amino acid transporter [unclassified Dietzia]AVZ39921.1 amino acid transporter [Dietzia sp. JS16-p6b]QGW25320.1 LysE family translocator protein [Dietzia sp. DQ12-45-1b]
MTTTSTLLMGAGMGLGLIAAVGAQNAYVLQRSIRGDVAMVPIVLFCVVSEAALLLLGVAGVGALVESAPAALTVMTWFGVVFLLAYGAVAASRALRPGSGLQVDGDSRVPSTLGAVAACAAFTWLNPHAYLDSVVFLGTLANQQAGDLRWVFAAGAFLAGTVWFVVIGFGGRALRGVFANPGAWRVLDAGIAVMMVALAVGLIRG